MAETPLSAAPHRRRTPLGRRWLFVALVAGTFLLLAGSGAAAALESDTVGSYWRGLWWATSLMTTVGFVGRPPATQAGAALSAVLMIAGFLLLSLVSASLASIFVRDSEKSFEREEQVIEQQLLARLDDIAGRLDSLEDRLRVSRRP
jgi:voltage-gated potassium channel